MSFDDCCFLCECTPEEIPFKILVKSCRTDDHAVATLPEDWTPKRCGPTLLKYLKEREKNHNELIDEISSEICGINRDIDDKAREITEVVSAQLQEHRKEIISFIEISSGVLSNLPDQDSLLKHVNELQNERAVAISEFRERGELLESERANRIKVVLRDKFQRMVAVGNVMFPELLKYFDQRMYECNELICSNIRAYREVDGDLRYQMTLHEKEYRAAIQQLISSGKIYRCTSVRRPLDYAFTSKKPPSICRGRSFESVHENTVDILYMTQLKIEEYFSQLVEAYRDAVREVVSGFSTHLNSLHMNLAFNIMSPQDLPYTQKLKEVIDKIMEYISHFMATPSAANLVGDALAQSFEDVRNSILSLADCLRRTDSILDKTGHLWDNHVMRCALAQKLTMAGVEYLESEHDITEQASEVDFNLKLSQLCLSPNEEVLKDNYNYLLSSLEEMNCLYIAHHQAETEQLKEFTKLSPILVDLLLTEFDCSLENSMKECKIRQRISNTRLEKQDNVSPLPRLLLQTAVQINSLKNWANGFIELFKLHLDTIPNSLMDQAQQWVDDKLDLLHTRHSMKLHSLRPRVDRIKVAYNNTLGDLRRRKARLTSHLNAITEFKNSTRKELDVVLSMESSRLFPLSEWLGRIENNIDLVTSSAELNVTPEVVRLKMLSYDSRLTRYRNLFEKSIDPLIDEYRCSIKGFIQKLRVSNNRFMKTIKTTLEGGEYSAIEANLTFEALNKACNEIEEFDQEISAAILNRQMELYAVADQATASLKKRVLNFLGKKPDLKSVSSKRLASKRSATKR